MSSGVFVKDCEDTDLREVDVYDHLGNRRNLWTSRSSRSKKTHPQIPRINQMIDVGEHGSPRNRNMARPCNLCRHGLFRCAITTEVVIYVSAQLTTASSFTYSTNDITAPSKPWTFGLDDSIT